MAEEFEARLEIQANRAIQDLAKLREAFEDAGLAGTNLAKGVANAERALARGGSAAKSAAGAADDAARATRNQEQETRKAQKALEDHYAGLSRTRYALYDVSGALAATGVAMTALGVATAATAITMERQFADVIRTSGIEGESSATRIDSLRDSFNELYSTTPISYETLTQIGSLAGQLNIAEVNMASFAETVAQFSSTTDVTAEAAGTALARLEELIPGVNGDFEALGSAILAVGTNSIATESQIVAISNQLSSLAQEASLSAGDVIGLSGALASVGVPPELARGTMVRLFGNIAAAVSGGGERLQEFARLSNMSAEEFSEAWRTNGAETLVSLFEGINASGQDMGLTLRGLGIEATRDIPTIQKLAQNTELLQEQIRIGNEEFASGSELQRQYSIISATTQERLAVLVNNFNLLVQALGNSVTAMGPVIDVMSAFLKVATQVAENPVGSSVAAIGIAVVALTAIFALGVAGILRYNASMIALKQAAFETTGQTNILAAAKAILTNRVLTNAGALGTETTALNANATASGRAATASNGAAAAGGKLSSILGKGGLVGSLLLAIPLLGELATFGGSSFEGLKMAIAQTTAEVDTYVKRLQGAIDASRQGGIGIDFQTEANVRNAATELGSVGGSLDFFEGGGNPIVLGRFQAYEEEIARVDEALARLAESGNAAWATDRMAEYVRILEEAGVESDIAAEMFSLTAATLDEGNLAASQAGASMDELAQQTADAVSSEVEATQAILDMNNALYALGEGLGEGGNAFDYFSEAGQTNIGNVLAVMNLLAQQSGGDAQATANSLKGLYDFIIANTGIAASQLGFLSQAIANLGGATGATTFDPSAFFNGFSSGANKAATAAKRAGGAARKAAREVRTLVDYANDLENVFSRSFDIRFGSQQALDDIASSFNQLAEENESARQAIMDYRKDIEDAGAAIRDYETDIASLRAEIQELTADRSIKSYFLDVANAYQDTLRAGVLRGEIAEIDADLRKSADEVSDAQKGIADEQKNIQKSNKGVKTETDKLTRSTDGNSQAAIDNRAALYGLVGQYQSYIQSLAASGADQNTLNAAVARSREQFIQQARQLGFTDQAIDLVVGSFNDMRVAIDRVPRNITVSANIDPAIQALNEFVAKARKAGSDAGGGIAGGVNNAIAQIKPPPIKVGFQLPSYQELMRMQQQIRDVTGDARFRIAVPQGQGGQVFGAAHGGFVPGPTPSNLNVDNVPAMTRAGVPLMLQGGEPIINNTARRYYGDAMFNAINAMKFPRQGFAAGGFAPSSVAVARGTGESSAMPMIDPRQMNQLIRAVQNQTATLAASPGALTQYTDQGRMAAARQGGQG